MINFLPEKKGSGKENLKWMFYKIYKIVWKNTLVCHLFSGIGIGGILASVSIRNSIVSDVVSKNAIQAVTETWGDVLIPLCLVFIFLLVNLLSFYFNENIEILNVFYILGIKKKDQRFFLLGLFGSFFVLDLFVGGLFGWIFLHLSEIILCEFFSYKFQLGLTTMSIGITILIWTILFLVILNFSYNNWNVRKYKDLSKEWIPKRHIRKGMILSVVVIVFLIYNYSKLVRFENKGILLGIIIWIYVFVRCLAAYSVKYKNISKKIKKVLKKNWIYCHSRTVSIFSATVVLLLICCIFIGNLQISTVLTAENLESLYPYDVVCYAYEEDQNKYAEIVEKYDLQMLSFPMVRISNMDITDALEFRGETPIQGQQIGISESTYNQLKKNIDPEFREKDLGLDVNGDSIYIVHQQDRSVRAQPIDYWLWSSSPLIHVGQPCVAIGYGTALEAREKDIGYSFKKVAGEEIGSLVGIFDCTGKQENIVVFSDEYFETARLLWKTTNRYTGEPISEEETAFLSELIKEGPSNLILLKDVNQNNRQDIQEDLKKIEDTHMDDLLYSTTVKNVYNQSDAKSDLRQTRIMKLSIAILQIILFVIMIIEVVIVEIVISKDELRKRDTLLDYLGMSRKKRFKMIKEDLLNMLHVGERIAVIVSIGLVIAVVKARMFEINEIEINVFYLAIIGCVVLAVVECAIQIVVNMWMYMSERRK